MRELERGAEARLSVLPPETGRVCSPLKLEAWQSLLKDHPDGWFAEYIVRGIRDGFRIGFRGDRASLRAGRKNMMSAMDHPEVVESYLSEEARLGRIMRINQEAIVMVHCSPFGVIPKKNRINKWRLILDLSAPEGASVNDGIPKELALLAYPSVDDVVSEVVRRGLIAKMDVKQAYRNVPVHPRDRHLLGMQWGDEVFVDNILPFGLRSAPLLFTAVADALQWAMKKEGVSWLEHYIDDFFTIGDPGSHECSKNVSIMKNIFDVANMPTEPEKDEGPATVINLLGMELDSIRLEIRLPLEKLMRLKSLLESWRGRKACRKRELLSLIGSLSHACKAVSAGRAFLRRIIDLSTLAKQPNHFLRLSAPARH